MRYTIRANTFMTNRYLKVKDSGIEFCETSTFGGVQRFRFDQIECILISPDHVLSFQVGKQVFSLPVQPKKKKHKETVKQLLAGVKRSLRSGTEVV